MTRLEVPPDRRTIEEIVRHLAPTLAKCRTEEEFYAELDAIIHRDLLALCRPVPGHPDVLAFTKDSPDELEIGGLISRPGTEGTGAVAAYLDDLPTARQVVVALVVNPRLIEMLERRGFVRRQRFMAEIGGGEWGTIYVRKPSR